MEDAALTVPLAPLSDNDNPMPHGASVRRPDTRGWWVGAGLAAAACAVGVVAVGALHRSDQAVREVAIADGSKQLADGSTAMLGPGGAISVAMSGDVRRITLERGEATFHVRKDPARPFIVQSGDVYAQATGTVYSVRRLGANGGAVDVAEGRVLVWIGNAKDKAVALNAGEGRQFDPAPFVTTAPKPASPLAQAKPKQGQEFSFDNMTIAQAAARFNKVNSTRIIIGDPAIRGMPVVGVFKADRPEQFAEAAAQLAEARLVHRGGNLVIEK